MVFLGMKEAKNSVKKVTSHILTYKNKMLRKKSKYDPKYSGKPTIVDSVAGSVTLRLRKQLPSLSGVVILLLIGYIAYEQIGKKSRTNVLEAEANVENLVQDKGKLLQDAPIEMLNDVRKVGRVDQYHGNIYPEQQHQNPKIKGVNDMLDKQHAMPLMPDGHDIDIGGVQQNNPGGYHDLNPQIDDTNRQVDNPRNPEIQDAAFGEAGQKEPINMAGLQNQLDKLQGNQQKYENAKPMDGNKFAANVENPRDFSEYEVIMRNGELVKHDSDQNKVKLPQIGNVDNNYQQIVQPLQNAKPKVKYPQPKMFPVKTLKTPKLECSEPLILLILVHTDAFNFGTRRVIRETWGIHTKTKFERYCRIQNLDFF